MKHYEVVVTIKRNVLVCHAKDEDEAKAFALDALGVTAAAADVKALNTDDEVLAATKRAHLASEVSVLGQRVIVEQP